jgi:hypothetical protein
MLTVYICFLAGGAVLPFINFLLGLASNGVDSDVNADTGIDADTDIDMDLDFSGDTDIEAAFDAGTDPDIGAEFDVNPEINADSGSGPGINPVMNADTGVWSMVSIGLFPTSFMSLSSLAITFGAVGGIMTLTGRGKLITFVIAAIAGYIVSVAIQTVIKSLKKAQTRSNGVVENELLLYDGTIVDTVLPGQMGSVSFVTLKNVRVNYPARCADESLRLAAGRVVKVKEIKNGIFIVEPKNRYE